MEDTTLFSKIEENAHIFYGINDYDEMFIQIATHENEIVYNQEVYISVNPRPRDLLIALKSIFSDSFKDLGMKISPFNFSDLDGHRLKDSGEIVECRATQSIYPKFREHLIYHLV